MTRQADVADVFASEWPQLVATLVRDVGDLGLAEDAAQDAFVEATERWPTSRWPDRPGAWLLTTARRKLIDGHRRSARYADRLALLARSIETEQGAPHTGNDDQLALLMGCCHPALAPTAQVALTLRAVAGLTTAQIARAFLVSESTMARRLTRSKAKIRTAGIPFEVPDLDGLARRLPAVCSTVYSIFTEGHMSATEDNFVRGDLCDEAIWLAELLVSLVPDDPEVLGLLALLVLIDSRRASRIGAAQPVLIVDQDRTQWDHAKIERGLTLLARAHGAHALGLFQLQAAVAALHATAPSFAATDWARIISLYDSMMRRSPTAPIALNRAIAVGHHQDPAAGLDALDTIGQTSALAGDLANYVYFHAARAEFLAELQRTSESRAAFDQALAACTSEAQSDHLRRRIDALTSTC